MIAEQKTSDCMYSTDLPNLDEVLDLKYGPSEQQGWGPQLRARFGYYTPDDLYEAYLLEQVTKDTVWLDVGCGRHLFPSNPRLANVLAQRCKLLVGADPSDNIDDNGFIHRRYKSSLEMLVPDEQFDLVTLRMVAEHVRRPERAIEALARLTRKSGIVVVYTVWKWSPASIVAASTPMSVHHGAKHFLWGTEERDTFPVEYRMNTRGTLAHLFEEGGFREEHFSFLDDCRSSHRSKSLNTIELLVWRGLRRLNLRYPERCILASYRKKAG